jgi:hypothetical protein
MFVATVSHAFPRGNASFILPHRRWNNGGMSPKSRGRPPDRRKKQRGQRPATRSRGPVGLVLPDTGEATLQAGVWFDEPDPGNRRSWAIPAGHGTYRELDLELLNPDDEDDLVLLMEARHPEFEGALERGE